MNRFTIIRSGDCFYVSRPQWATRATSFVSGVGGEFYSRADAVAYAEGLSAVSDEALAQACRMYETPERFEIACEAGVYGAPWE